MLRNYKDLNGSAVNASDGEIGKVKDVYFDDEGWAVRYLVVDAGSWLTGREVLVSPYAVRQPVGSGRLVDVTLTREQVKNSPPVDTHKPVSRQHEREWLGYHGYPAYWGGSALWGATAYPVLPPVSRPVDAAAGRTLAEPEPVREEDVHLRSAGAVRGHDIQATDGSIGEVEDFLFDDESWALRYFIVDTRKWWPGGKKVLIGTRWVERIDWSDSKVVVSMTREQVKNSPEFDIAVPVERDYESRLHEHYGRSGYWT